MTDPDEPVPPSVLVVAAGFTIDLHRTQTCSKCSTDGCAHLLWAQGEIKRYRREREAEWRRLGESAGGGEL